MKTFTDTQTELHIEALACLSVIKSINSLTQPVSDVFFTMRANNQVRYSEVMADLMGNILPGNESNASPLDPIFESMLNQFSPEKN